MHKSRRGSDPRAKLALSSHSAAPGQLGRGDRRWSQDPDDWDDWSLQKEAGHSPPKRTPPSTPRAAMFGQLSSASWAVIGFVALLVTASVVFGLTVFAGWGSGDDSGFREASLASGKPDMPMQGSADWSSGRGNAASLARSAQLSELQEDGLPYSSAAASTQQSSESTASTQLPVSQQDTSAKLRFGNQDQSSAASSSASASQLRARGRGQGSEAGQAGTSEAGKQNAWTDPRSQQWVSGSSESDSLNALKVKSVHPNVPGFKASNLPNQQHMPGLASQTISAQPSQTVQQHQQQSAGTASQLPGSSGTLTTDQAAAQTEADLAASSLLSSTEAAGQGSSQRRFIITPLNDTVSVADQGLSELKAADISALDTRSDPTAQAQLGLAAGLPQAAVQSGDVLEVESSSDPIAADGSELESSSGSSTASAVAQNATGEPVQTAGRVRRKGKYRRSSALTDKTGPGGLSELELQSGILDSDLPNGTDEGSEGLTGAPKGTDGGADVSWPGIPQEVAQELGQTPLSKAIAAAASQATESAAAGTTPVEHQAAASLASVSPTALTVPKEVAVELLSTPGPSTMPRPTDHKQPLETQQQQVDLATGLSSEAVELARMAQADAAALEAELNAAWEAVQEAEPQLPAATGFRGSDAEASQQVPPVQPVVGASQSSSDAPASQSAQLPSNNTNNNNTSGPGIPELSTQQNDSKLFPAGSPGQDRQVGVSATSAIGSAVNATVSSAVASVASTASTVNETVSSLLAAALGGTDGDDSSPVTPKSSPKAAPEAVARPAILANPTQQTLLEAAASLVKEAQEATSDAPVSQQAAASVSQELPDGSQEPSRIPRESGGIPREDSPIQGLVRGYPGGSGEQSDSLQSLRDRQAGLQGEQVDLDPSASTAAALRRNSAEEELMASLTGSA